METRFSLYYLILAFCAAGCAHNARQSSSAFSKEAPPPPPAIQAPSSPPPRDAGERPVWVLPVFSTGYVSGAANQSGVYVGPHSVTSVVEAGHWASQEEAELQGRPYVTSSNRIVYPNGANADGLSTSAGQMEVAASTIPRSAQPSTTPASTPTPPPPSATPAPNQEVPEPPLPSESPSPNMPDLPSAAPSPAANDQPATHFQVLANTPAELIFTGGRVGERYVVDLTNGKKVDISYLSEKKVQLASGTTSKVVAIQGLESRVKVRLTTQ
jgi:hypothetical protein